MLTIKEIGQKLAPIIGNKGIEFERNTYDSEDAMPFLILNGEKQIVTWASLNDVGNFLEVDMKDGSQWGINLDSALFGEEWNMTDEKVEKQCGEMGVYELLYDMYNYLGFEEVYGDFETDFLGMTWWDLSK